MHEGWACVVCGCQSAWEFLRSPRFTYSSNPPCGHDVGGA